MLSEFLFFHTDKEKFQLDIIFFEKFECKFPYFDYRKHKRGKLLTYLKKEELLYVV